MDNNVIDEYEHRIRKINEQERVTTLGNGLRRSEWHNKKLFVIFYRGIMPMQPNMLFGGVTHMRECYGKLGIRVEIGIARYRVFIEFGRRWP